MSQDRKGRRRFLADLLFAGGAVTAASVLGYAATHWPAPVVAPEVTTSPDGITHCVEPTPEVQTCAEPPSQEIHPSGRSAPARRDPMKPISERRDTNPAGGAMPAIRP